MGFTSSGCVNFLFLPERLTSGEKCRDRNDRIGSSQVFCDDSSDSFKRHFLSWFIWRLWVFLVPEQYRLVRQSFDGAYFPECHVVLVGLEKDFIARKEMFLMGRDGFLELCLPWNEFIEDGLIFLANIVSAGERPICVLGLGVILYTCRNCCNTLSVGVSSAFLRYPRTSRPAHSTWGDTKAL